MQAVPPKGFPFFGMAPSVLSAISRQTDIPMAVTSSMSDGMQCLLASAQISEQQAAASGTHAAYLLLLACDVSLRLKPKTLQLSQSLSRWLFVLTQKLHTL